MSRWIAVVAFALVGCGGLSPKDFCNEWVQATCDWASRCGYSNQAACESTTIAAQCANATEETLCGSTGRRFDGGKASACVSQFETLSCSTTSVTSVTACQEICTAAGSSGGGGGVGVGG